MNTGTIDVSGTLSGLGIVARSVFRRHRNSGLINANATFADGIVVLPIVDPDTGVRPPNMITGAIVNAGDIEVSGSNSGTNDAFVVGKVFVDYDGRLAHACRSIRSRAA